MIPIAILNRSLKPFTETVGAKIHNPGKHKLPVGYMQNKPGGYESLKIFGLNGYRKQYEMLPMHPESIEAYASVTTKLTTEGFESFESNGITYHMSEDLEPSNIYLKLTPFAIMEHCQMQMTGNKYLPVLNLN